MVVEAAIFSLLVSFQVGLFHNYYSILISFVFSKNVAKLEKANGIVAIAYFEYVDLAGSCEGR